MPVGRLINVFRMMPSYGLAHWQAGVSFFSMKMAAKIGHFGRISFKA